MNKIILIIIVVLVLIIGGYFFWKEVYQYPTPITPTVPVLTTPELEENPGATTEAREITVIGSEFSFNPDSITVSAGQKVKIDFRNLGRVLHNLTIEGLAAGTKTISGGQIDTLEFIVPTSGIYPFYCSVPGHRAAGMEGSLIIK